MHRSITTVAALLAAVLAVSAPCQEGVDDQRLAWWREARFGLFIHWGLYAIPAGQWRDATDHAEWIRDTAQIPIEEYDRLVAQFDPVKFDAGEWARMAAAAGMRYVVITSKHHDGFCLFDSAHTDFDAMSTPFGRDIMKEVADAFRARNLRVCWYHSIMDWHHPDYLPRRGWEQAARPAEGADMARYVRHLQAQVQELLTKYGPIGVMWFDGEWESTWTHEWGAELYQLCRRLQPGVIVNNRVDVGRGGMAGLTKAGEFVGDFGTPEQEVPPSGLPGVDWESCITMNDHWGYNAHDENWKTPRALIRLLVDVASKGGNLLLNVGPRADGTFPPACVERLAAIGRWMKVNGEAIHGTTQGPFGALPWGRCTAKRSGDTTVLYLHVFDWPRDRVLVLPGLGSEPVRAWLLAGGAALDVTRADADVRIALPPRGTDVDCSVIGVEVRGAPIVYPPPMITGPAPFFVKPIEVEVRAAAEGSVVRYTLDGSAPGADSPRTEGPIRLSETTTVRARAFDGDRPVSTMVEATFTRAKPRPALPAAADLVQGLWRSTFRGDWKKLPDYPAYTADAREPVASLDLPTPREERIAYLFEGRIEVPEDDAWMFALTSDDGSRLWIDGEPVIDHDGLHSASERQGAAPLAAGMHFVHVEWFNATGDAALALRWGRLGGTLAPVPAAALWRPRH